MSMHEDLEQLRRELKEWRLRGMDLTQRLDTLEAQVRAGTAKKEELPPPIPSAVQSDSPVAGVTSPPIPTESKPEEAASPETHAAFTAARESFSAGLTAHEKEEVSEPKPAPAKRKSEVPLLEGEPWLAKAISFIKNLGPKEDMDWEMALTTYWLPRTAMPVFLAGVVMFMVLIIDKYRDAAWVPYVRVATGYAICAILLGAGKWLEKSTLSYARVLMSGGFALSYFVTYATYFVPYARIFQTPIPALLGLGVVVGAWGGVAQVRRSHLIALAVTLLGHLTVALSTVELAQPPKTGILALLFLGAVSGFFMIKNRWYYVAAAGMLCSHANYFLWLVKGPGGDTVFDFTMGISVAVLIFLTYACCELFAPEGLRRRAVSLRWRTIYTATNSSAFLFLAWVLMKGFPFTRHETHWLYWSYGVVLFAVGAAYLRRLKGDPLFNAYLSKAMGVTALGFTVYFDGPMLTLALALQALALLWGARWSGLLVNRFLALGAAALAFLHGLYELGQYPAVLFGAEGFWPQAVPALSAVLVLLALSQLHQRTDWTIRTPAKSKWFPALCWKLDLIHEPPEPGLEKPLGGLLMPFVYAAGAAILATGYVHNYTADAHTGWVMSMAALLLAAGGAAVASKPYTATSLLLIASAVFAWITSIPSFRPSPFIYMLDAVEDLGYGAPEFMGNVLVALGVILPFFCLGELVRLTLPRRPGAWLNLQFTESGRQVPVLPHGYACVGALLSMVAVRYYALPPDQATALACLAATAGAYAFASKSVNLGLASLLFTAAAPFFLTDSIIGGTAEPRQLLYAALALFGTALLCESRYFGAVPGLALHQRPGADYFLYAVAAWACGWYIREAHGLYAFALAVLAAHALMCVLKPGPLGAVGAGFLVWLEIAWLDHGAPEPAWYIIGAGAPLLAFAAERWQVRFNVLRGIPGGVMLAAGWSVLLAFLYDWLGDDWYALAWLAASAVYLGYAANFRVRTAAVLGLAGAVLATRATLVHAYTAPDWAWWPMTLTFASLALFWGALERLVHLWDGKLAAYLAQEARRALEILLVAVPCVLVLLLLERLPIHLTISWTIAALGMFAPAIALKQRLYRYAALLTFGLALFRVFFIDMRELPPMQRTMGVMFLGAVLLVVSYVYIRVRDYMRRAQKGTEEE